MKMLTRLVIVIVPELLKTMFVEVKVKKFQITLQITVHLESTIFVNNASSEMASYTYLSYNYLPLVGGRCVPLLLPHL